MTALSTEGYDPATIDYVTLDEARQHVAAGRELVSATHVVPYPPGFPVLVPGQVVSDPILDFLTHLDVGEIHGYDPDLGLSVGGRSRNSAHGRSPICSPIEARPCVWRSGGGSQVQ